MAFTHDFPRYSPDLNPLDYSTWYEIERRMFENEPAKVESVEQYKRRLRATALGLPKSFVSKAVRLMAARVRECRDVKGANLSGD